MNLKKSDHLFFHPLFACLLFITLTAIDQFTKIMAIEKLKNKPPFEILKGIFEFQYCENDGIAFGLFSGKISIFLIFSLVFLVIATIIYKKIPKTPKYFPLTLVLIVMASGAVGNFIDRLTREYVVDFIYFRLIDFPIFNIADIYVVCGCIAMIFLLLVKYQDEDFAFMTLKQKDKP